MAFDEALRARYRSVLGDIESSGLTKKENIITVPQSTQIQIQSADGGGAKDVVNFCSSNYLGLSSHPLVLDAAHRAIDRRGYGLSSVRFICGTQDIHKELELAITKFLGTEDTILFSSCFDANAAVFEALLGENDIILSDRLVHASIVDGIRLSKAQHDTYKHGDVDHLRRKLESFRDKEAKVIVTDGVFSMDGDLAPLREIAELADEFGALICVDDSHATGFFGANGRGTHEHFGLLGQIDIITTTFGKALGGASGGCVSGRKELVDLLRQRGRPYLFSNTLSPVIAGATVEVLRLLEITSDRREALWENTAFWRRGLVEIGLVIKEGHSPIVPVMLYNAKLTQEFAAMLFQRGVYAVGFSYPVVPVGQARIRTQVSASHSRSQLEAGLTAFADTGKELGVIGLSKDQIADRFGT